MKALPILRDLVVIVGISLLCFVAISRDRKQEHDRAARFQLATKAIADLDEMYKASVFDSSENKGIYQQMFRQNEILMQYQKLSLLKDLTPVGGLALEAAPPLPK